MPRDPEKARARKRRYLEHKKIEKYGPAAAGKNMTGRHGNHAKGEKSGRWNPGPLITSHGYVAVRVPIGHPHAWGPPSLASHRYAYKHIVVMMKAVGRPLGSNEVVHHRNGDRQDNRLRNLELQTVNSHARDHSLAPGARDQLGRFRANVRRHNSPPELRVREWPR